MNDSKSNRGGTRVPVSDKFVETLEPYAVTGRSFDSETGYALKAFLALRRKHPTKRFVSLESFIKVCNRLELTWSHVLDLKRIKQEDPRHRRLIDYLKKEYDSRDEMPEAPRASGEMEGADEDALRSSIFIAGPEIRHPRQFFGRERELKNLFNSLKSDPLQCSAIVGSRRSGKTSLLRYLAKITNTPRERLRSGQRNDWLADPTRYRWIFVDFRSSLLSNPEGVFRCLLNGVGLPETDSVDQGRFLKTMSLQLNRPTVVLMDGIDKALGYQTLNDNPSFWNGLRSLASNSGNLAYVVTSTEGAPDLAKRFEAFGSPFLNYFGHHILLGPLTDGEAHELIQSSPREFPPDDVEWIVERSRCWPHLLQKFCYERLMALENGEKSEAWRDKGLADIDSP
jgi:hypothetical protein